MAKTEEEMGRGWRSQWPTAEEIAGHARASFRGWWLARSTEPGLNGHLFVGFFDVDRMFTIASPPREPGDPADTFSTTLAPGWSFCPLDDRNGMVLGASEVVGAEPVLIWSDEHEAWWLAYGLGYTKVRAEAGIFKRQDAIRRTREGYLGQLVGLRDTFAGRTVRSKPHRPGAPHVR